MRPIVGFSIGVFSCLCIGGFLYWIGGGPMERNPVLGVVLGLSLLVGAAVGCFIEENCTGE